MIPEIYRRNIKVVFLSCFSEIFPVDFIRNSFLILSYISRKYPMILYHSKFLRVNYLELQYLMHFFWSEYALHMDAEGMYYETVRFMKNRIKRRADQVYLDWRNVENLIAPETFPWYVRHIFPGIFSAQPYRLGILLNRPEVFDFPEKVTINGKTVPVRVFSDAGLLTAWLTDGAVRKKPGGYDHGRSKGSCRI